jgi:hypothetical protein
VREASCPGDLLDHHDGNISAAGNAAGVDRETRHRLTNKRRIGSWPPHWGDPTPPLPIGSSLEH